MKNLVKFPVFFLVLATAFFGCTKSDNLQTAQLEDFMPMQPGKYIRYQLDSMIFVDFGQRDTTISYEAKDVVDAEITDNAGRRSYRVIRYLRPLGSSDESEYAPNLTYMVTPTRESIEVQENNLRFQKLRLPITAGFNWRGNTYLPSTPYYAVYEFSNDEDIDLWNYTYENLNESVAFNNNVYDSTITVVQVADSSNVPIEFPDALGYKNHWTEVYAKNVGLIYKEVEMWEYQPPNAGNPGFRAGFGIKLTIIDRN